MLSTETGVCVCLNCLARWQRSGVNACHMRLRGDMNLTAWMDITCVCRLAEVMLNANAFQDLLRVWIKTCIIV